PVPGFELARTFNHNGTIATGSYPGWDRFGRLARQMWVDTASTAYGAGANNNVPNEPPILEEALRYDAGSNLLETDDARPGAAMPNWDFEHSYDGLDRLTESRRGILDTTDHDFSSPGVKGKASQAWELDGAGNWSKFKTDVGADHDYGATNETDVRTH